MRKKLRLFSYSVRFFADGAGGAPAGGAGGAPGGGTPAPAGGTPPPAGGAPAGGAPAPVDFMTLVPEEYRTEPSLKDIKDMGGLVKSYINAQKLIGVDKIPAPKENWTAEQWAQFWNQTGRPGTVDGYSLPDDKTLQEAGVKKENLAPLLKLMHDNGLNTKQATAVLNHMIAEEKTGLESLKANHQQAMADGMNQLKEMFKDKLPAKLDIAKAVFRQFGDDALSKMFVESGLANNPAVVQMFVKIGEAMLDDKVLAGGGVLQINDATRAVQEINALKLDESFIKTLRNERAVGHAEAVERWTKLHQTAYPTPKQE